MKTFDFSFEQKNPPQTLFFSERKQKHNRKQ